MDELMKTCPKWDSCNAPICPLDDGWELRTMTNDDSICRYLREYVKIQSGMAEIAAFQHDLHDKAQKRIESVVKRIRIKHAVINKKLEMASKTPSKMTPGWKGVAEQPQARGN